MSRFRHAFLIITGRLPAMKDEDMDNTLSIASQINAGVQRLIALVQASQAAASSAQQSVTDTANAVASAQSADDAAGVSALQPILDNINSVAPAPVDDPSVDPAAA